MAKRKTADPMNEMISSKEHLSRWGRRLAVLGISKTGSDLGRNLCRCLNGFFEDSPLAIVALNRKREVAFWNPAAEHLFGWMEDELLGKPYPLIPEGKDGAFEALWIDLLNGRKFTGIEQLSRRCDGPDILAALSTSALKDEQGRIIGAIGFLEDITERTFLESQLRQAQKMEGVGRLAGGVAHDFNNLLTTIMGLSELILKELPVENPMREDIEEIKAAGNRAGQLTQQLLAFSRRQLVAPKYIELNDVIEDMRKMLCRIIGEDIELTFDRGDGLGYVLIDPGQAEQLVMNLAVNARDAMPDGGKLIIKTAKASIDEQFAAKNPESSRGDHILLSMSDTGGGMTDEIKAHLFEPFFTTKEQGKGTGLGLATCYGIVKQNKGYIAAESEPGHGATFRVYLPLVREPPELTKEKASAAKPNGGRETILVVEDDISIRRLAERILKQLGYDVLVASDGEEGLRVVARDSKKKIRLVVTDIVMPKLGGKKMAETLGAKRPDLKFIYTSGYTDEAVFGRHSDNPSARFLRKPYSLQDLAQAVREALDE